MNQYLKLSILSVLLWIQPWFQLSSCLQFFVLMAPNVLHTGNYETIVIQGHECNKSQKVDIGVYSFPNEDKELCKTVVHLNSTNNYLATGYIKIPSSYISSDINEKQYVVVRAKSTNIDMQKVILLSPHTGYIFIQTDKTIYTPNQNVNYRIFSTDQNLDPTDRIVIVLLQNPDGIIVNKEDVKISNGLAPFSLKIPELVSIGIWKLVAKFQDAQQEEYTTQFEVREYVLPTFNVELDTENKFFYYKDEELIVNIKARYLFGQAVNGYAVAIFGLYKDFLKSLHGSMTRVQISNGVGHVKLKRTHLLEGVSDEKKLLGLSIYVNVTVFSADGDYVQMHKTNIKIVSSPYNIMFTRTPNYFKPGMTFKLTVSVTNPDMTPAARVLVKCKGTEGRTSEEGLAELIINTEGNQRELTLTVKTAVENLQEDQQATATMKAKMYQPTWSPIFLHIAVNGDVKDVVHATLNIKSEKNSINEKIKYFTILVVSRGKILQTIVHRRTQQEIITAVSINVTPDMLPSFRIVGYFYLFHEDKILEVVSDSVWLHMKPSCKGALTINPPQEAFSSYGPQDSVDISLTGDNGAQVGLVIVDKAVFVLNNKTKLTQNKIWDAVQENDIGCSAGSGADPLGVFKDAGLEFATSLGIKTQARTDSKCSSDQHGRKRRSIKMLEAKQKKANESPAHLRPCCLAGLHDSPMGLPCSKRKQRVRHGKACVNMFFECCTHAEKLKSQFSADTEWDRSDDSEEDLEEDSTLRSYFPESWHFNIIVLSDTKSKSNTATVPLSLRLPDSITTWVVQAVSIKKTQGICVSNPYELMTSKKFFVDLRMPYSVIRNEQVQIRAIVHNYHSSQAKVKVKFPYNENICSLATKSSGYQETLSVAKNSVKVMYFVIIPLVVGKVEIEVQAQMIGKSIIDRVRKSLNVLPEGKLMKKQLFSTILNPEGKSQLIHIRKETLDRMVPDSPASNFISIQGDIMGETVLGILQHSEIGSLISVPSGCPEQVMISTTSNVILTRYLDANKKWDIVGAEKRSKAIDNIKQGYMSQLIHRLSDYSFQNSTWLTAYVVKIFALASTLVHIDTNMLCNSSKWLVTKQNNDGEFMEHGEVYSKQMQGGYREYESSLTAFVLIALAEVKNKCKDKDIDTAVKKAKEYLETKFPNLQQTYSAVITSYALSLVGSTKDQNIDKFAHRSRTYWPVENFKTLFTVEATSYALLQKLKLKKFNETHKIAELLVKVRGYGGGYRSTQATVIALQALTQYKMDIPTDDQVNLAVQLLVEGRGRPMEYTIRNENVYMERTDKVSANKNLTVNVRGTGKGTLTVMTVYHALLTDENKCNGFTLKAEVNIDDRKPETYNLMLRARYSGLLPATMSLIEVTMLTGFSPNMDDLKQLASSVENYIMKYETEQSLFNGSVVLYLTKVPNNEDLVIGFRIHKKFQVGLLQPADISIYEYYDLDKRCSTFYNLPDESGHLRKLCKGSSCKCATGLCGSVAQMTNVESLKEKACSEGIDFVFKVHLTHSERKASYDYYNVTILDVIKEGADIQYISAGEKRQFIGHMACRDSLQLKTNMEYLIMNHYTDVWEVSSLYVFSSKSYILIWQNDQALTEFADTMKTNGCNT
ncbi:complement C3-like [Mixophyes fleayi]|uniref:complement C3-like n=1 Tax=Mixophyes fleayi TaxID=3061075 RepID=UPI003F4E4114